MPKKLPDISPYASSLSLCIFASLYCTTAIKVIQLFVCFFVKAVSVRIIILLPSFQPIGGAPTRTAWWSRTRRTSPSWAWRGAEGRRQRTAPRKGKKCALCAMIRIFFIRLFTALHLFLYTLNFYCEVPPKIFYFSPLLPPFFYFTAEGRWGRG